MICLLSKGAVRHAPATSKRRTEGEWSVPRASSTPTNCPPATSSTAGSTAGTFAAPPAVRALRLAAALRTLRSAAAGRGCCACCHEQLDRFAVPVLQRQLHWSPAIVARIVGGGPSAQQRLDYRGVAVFCCPPDILMTYIVGLPGYGLYGHGLHSYGWTIAV